MSAVADGKVIIEAILDTANVSKNVSGLGKELNGISWKNIAAGDEKAKALSGSFKSAGTACTMSFTAPIVAGGTAFAKMGMDFDDAMAKVSTIADTSQVPMGDLRSAILDLSDDTGIAASDIADNVYNAISAGQSTGDAVSFVSNATKLATAGFTDSASALDILSTTMNAYGMEADQVNRVSDVLLMTQNKGKTTVGELSANMGKVIPTASAYGVSLENLAAAYATTTAKGIATAESTTYISGMLNELGDSGSNVGKIVQEKLGMSFKECMDSGMSLGEVLDVCRQYADENGVSLNELFGSAEAGKAALAIAGDGIEGFTGNLDAMNASSGATDEAFGKMQTDSWDLNKAINEIKNVMIEFGGVIMTALQPAIEGFIGGVKGFSDWFKSLGEGGQTVILIILGIAAAIGPVLSIMGSLIGNINTIRGAITAMKEAQLLASAATKAQAVAQGILNAVMSANPFTLIVIAIMAVVAALVYLFNTNEGFRAGVMAVWDAIWGFIGPIIEGIGAGLKWLGDTVGGVWDFITGKTSDSGTQMASDASTAFGSMESSAGTSMSSIGGIMDGAMGNIKATSNTAWANISSGAESNLSSMESVTGSTMGSLSGIFGGSLDGMEASSSDSWSSILSGTGADLSSLESMTGSTASSMESLMSGSFGSMDSEASSKMKSISSSMSSGMQDASKSVTNEMLAAVRELTSAMKQMTDQVSTGIGSMEGKFSGASFGFPHIPMPHFSISGEFSLNPPSIPSFGIDWYAKGSVFNGPSVIGVGEAGPEAVVPLSGRNMLPFAEAIAKRMPSSDTEGNITINIERFEHSGGEIDDEELLRRIAQKIKSKQRAGGFA